MPWRKHCTLGPQQACGICWVRPHGGGAAAGARSTRLVWKWSGHAGHSELPGCPFSKTTFSSSLRMDKTLGQVTAHPIHQHPGQFGQSADHRGWQTFAAVSCQVFWRLHAFFSGSGCSNYSRLCLEDHDSWLDHFMIILSLYALHNAKLRLWG